MESQTFPIIRVTTISGRLQVLGKYQFFKILGFCNYHQNLMLVVPRLSRKISTYIQSPDIKQILALMWQKNLVELEFTFNYSQQSFETQLSPISLKRIINQDFILRYRDVQQNNYKQFLSSIDVVIDPQDRINLELLKHRKSQLMRLNEFKIKLEITDNQQWMSHQTLQSLSVNTNKQQQTSIDKITSIITESHSKSQIQMNQGSNNFFQILIMLNNKRLPLFCRDSNFLLETQGQLVCYHKSVRLNGNLSHLILDQHLEKCLSFNPDIEEVQMIKSDPLIPTEFIKVFQLVSTSSCITKLNLNLCIDEETFIAKEQITQAFNLVFTRLIEYVDVGETPLFSVPVLRTAFKLQVLQLTLT